MEGLMSKMTTIFAPPPPPSFSSRNDLAAAPTKSPDRKFSGHHPPPGSATPPSFSLNRRPAFLILALLAAVAVGLLFLLPGGLLQAQSAEQFIDYPENGDGPVATFTASDPEGASPGYWSILAADATFIDIVGVETADAADADLFKIDQNGVLSFKDSPNYEAPADAGEGNEYRVTVQASDGDQTGYFAVYVNVTDEEETGKITWSVTPTDGTAIAGLRQFQPGAVLAASVTDPDAVTSDDEDGNITSGITWKWYRGSSVISDATEAMYTVADGDVGSTIRVMATYSDGSGAEESVSLTSSASVQTFRRSNADPAFASENVTRRIAENSTGNIGGPVVATDTDGDTLTYAITGGADQASFRIDPATGQLMVGPGLMIDFEDTVNTDDSYTVEVTAYDSSGAPTNPVATVTINVIDEEEKPTFGAVVDTDGSEENIMRAMVAENVTGTDLNIASYTATDPEGESVSLSLMGDDAGLFELGTDTDSGNGVNQELSFKKSPDFEMPGDRNDDNLYEVTVRASDGTLSADRMVVVKVTNDDAEGGKVTLSPEDAVLGVELTATLTDPEGGVSASGQITGERWTWHKDETNADFTANTGNAITNATSPTYTPVSDDVGDYLRAMVTYTYQFGGSKTGTSDAVQVQTSRENQAPRFKEGASTFRVVMEDVAANDADDTTTDSLDAATNDNVGSPIVATDANGDTIAYTLSGADASLFRIRSDNGQLEVKGKLDHEADTSHTVMVMANDGSGGSNATASITVTIYVTDVDEAPKIMVGGLAISGMPRVDYAEDRRDAVATYTASGPDAASARWSLEGDDAGAFRIGRSDGMLTFRSAPDYENPADKGGDNTYMLTVKAYDGTYMDTHDVIVTVTNVDEDGTVTLSPAQPVVGTELTATLNDPDSPSGVTVVAWQWASQNDDGTTYTDIIGANDAAYTPLEADAGKILQATASYTDGEGSGKSVQEVTASAVVAEVAGVPGDSNNDGEVDKREVIAAFQAYVSNPVDKAQIIAIFQQYIADAASSQ